MKIFDSLKAMAKKPATTDTPTATPQGSPSPVPLNAEATNEAILAAIQKHIGPLKTGSGFDIPPPLPVPPQLIAHLVKDYPGTLLTDEQHAALIVVADEWRAAVAALNAAGRDKVRAAFDAEQREVAESVIAGKPAADGWSREDIASDFAARRSALKTACCERSLEAGKLFVEAATKLIAYVQQRAEAEAVSEFRRYAAVSVDYVPSRLVQTLLAAAGYLERQIAKAQRPAILGNDPRVLFATVSIEL